MCEHHTTSKATPKQKGLITMRKSIAMLAVAGMLVAQSASALELLNDSLTWSSAGLFATANWNTADTWLSWSISQDMSTLVWSYEYTWHTGGKDLSHINIQVTDGADIDDFWNWSFSREIQSGDPMIGTFAPKSGNPGMPDSIYAL